MDSRELYKFKANRSRGLRVKIRHTNNNTNRDYYFIYRYLYLYILDALWRVEIRQLPRDFPKFEIHVGRFPVDRIVNHHFVKRSYIQNIGLPYIVIKA